jgi:hypothetical protein
MPIGTVEAVELAQIQGGHRVQHDEHQIVFGQPLPHVHRQQQRLITLRRPSLVRPLQRLEPGQETLPDASFQAVDKDLVAIVPGQAEIARQFLLLNTGICGEPGMSGPPPGVSTAIACAWGP